MVGFLHRVVVQKFSGGRVEHLEGYQRDMVVDTLAVQKQNIFGKVTPRAAQMGCNSSFTTQIVVIKVHVDHARDSMKA